MEYISSSKLIDEVQKKILGKIFDKTANRTVHLDDFYFKEGDFVKDFGASRSTVREAVRSLEVRGYVQRVHGKGVRAIDRSVQVVAESINDMMLRGNSTMEDMIEVRRIIEVKAAGIAAIRRSDAQCLQMKHFIDIMRDKDVSYKDYLEADLSFHRTVVEATENKILIALVASYEQILRDAITASTSEDYRPEFTERYHEAVYAEILSGNKEGAETSMKRHLDATKKNMEALKKVSPSDLNRISVNV